ncbi:MAG: preprotein translocase subunit YajC [bacterium]|nr:preprotein translocase subunit YajC [bacterium]
MIFAWMAPAGGEGTSTNPLMFLVPWVLIIVIIYFLMIRPQVKRQKQHKAMVDSLQKGDKVTAAGGMVGSIAGFKEKENTVILKVDDNVKIEVLRSSITAVFKKEQDGA